MKKQDKPILLILSSYPNRECGIATYSRDLVDALKSSYALSYDVRICALENGVSKFTYDDDVLYTLDCTNRNAYAELALQINSNPRIRQVMIQHEFGLFGGNYGVWIKRLLRPLHTDFSIVFHTVLPNPDNSRYKLVRWLTKKASNCIVMTQHAKAIIANDYALTNQHIDVIPHGTHPQGKLDTERIRENFDVEHRRVVSTFGLLSSNKCIETALLALPQLISSHPDLLYVVIGKTHPEVVKHEGEHYRNSLHQLVERLNIQNHVRFIDRFLPNDELLQWLHISEVYLFTSRDPHQAVSGTFAYAMSSGCPIIATAIPHAKEYLSTGAGRLIDFESPDQLGFHLAALLSDHELRNAMRSEALHAMKKTEWNNVALNYLKCIQPSNHSTDEINLPPVELKHLVALMGKMGIYQFAQHGIADRESGYTLDDNARALIASCHYFTLKSDPAVLMLIDRFLNFIDHCQLMDGRFVNYVDDDGRFTPQNDDVDLEDSNGRAVWALGFLLAQHEFLPKRFVDRAWRYLICYLDNMQAIQSPRALAFHIKGLHYVLDYTYDARFISTIDGMADQLKEAFYQTKSGSWKWYEDQLTYANSILPESMLLAYQRTKNPVYKTVANLSFDFLIEHVFENDKLHPISNNGWHHRTQKVKEIGGQQPIDVAYMVMSLRTFYHTFQDADHLKKMVHAFHWFLGDNHLNQLIYNPTSGGCHDGLEITNVNLNQGAESTICYLMARLTLEETLASVPLHNRSSYSKYEESPYAKVRVELRPTL